MMIFPSKGVLPGVKLRLIVITGIRIVIVTYIILLSIMSINLRYLLLGLCCLPGLLFSQKPVRKGVAPQNVTKSKPMKFSEEGLQGKWQEISRYSEEEKKVINFSDTLMIGIQQSTVEIRESGGS